MIKTKFQNIAILDIGSSKIGCLLASRTSFGELKVIGYGNQVSQGIGYNSVISDIKLLESAIVRTISVVEKNSGKDIDKVFVNISGNMLDAKIHMLDYDISNGEIKDHDLLKIKRDAYYKYSTNNSEVIQVIPVNYEIDDIPGIGNPSHMYGKKLKAYLNVVSISRTAKKNLLNCLARCHLNVLAIVPSGYASSVACLTRDEINDGAVLLDIGNKNTDVALYLEGKMHYISSIPIGGNLVTRDIQQIFNLSYVEAERLKIIYGSIFADNDKNSNDPDLFDIVNTNDLDNYVQKHKLAEIIYERMNEILCFIDSYLHKDKLVGKLYKQAKINIILSGGCGNLIGIDQLATKVFKSKTVIKAPNNFIDMPLEHKDPSFASIYGMLKIAEQFHHDNLHELVLFEDDLNLFKFIRDISAKSKIFTTISKYF